MRLRFWGVRGTIPVPGPDTLKTGGNTACISVRTSDDQLIIIDAGSGIRRLGQLLEAQGNARIKGNLLISHTHWDHIQGFPYFGPAFARNNRFVIVGQKRVGQRLEEILAGQIIEPYLPFDFKTLYADFHVKEVSNHETIVIGDETVVRAAELTHPGGCLGFRIENSGAVLVYCTDLMHPEKRPDPNIVRLAKGADLLVHDAYFDLPDRDRFSHWGHSSWLEAARFALAAEVKVLALFHYSPDATDRYLEEEILPRAREVFPATILAREGMIIDLPFEENRWMEY